MKDLFYSTRLDKSNNKLMTSYTNEKMRDKFGGKDATHRDTLYFAEIRADGTASISETAKGPIVRSLLINTSGTAGDSGRFVLWGKKNGRWAETPFSFAQYGDANAAMKAMIGMYDSLLILTSADESETPQESLSGMNSEYEVTGEI